MPVKNWKPKYMLDELRPGESHFVKGGCWHAVQSYLSFVRRAKGLLREAEIKVEQTVSGVIIRRVA